MAGQSWESLDYAHPPNRTAALRNAIVLALNAPGDEQFERAAALAAEIAEGMSADEVEAAKAAALEHYEP